MARPRRSPFRRLPSATQQAGPASSLSPWGAGDGGGQALGPAGARGGPRRPGRASAVAARPRGGL